MKTWIGHLFLRLALLGLCLAALPARAADAPPAALEMGVFPNLSPRAVIQLYQPLRLFLEKELRRPVNLYTAPDFATFVARTQKGEFDLLVTAPHFARLAQSEARYAPLANYAKRLQALIVVSGARTAPSLSGLRGGTIAIPDRVAVMSMMGIQKLRDAGLDPETDLTLFDARTHSNAAVSVQRGQTDAAIIGSVPFAQLPAEVRDQLKVLATVPPIPNQFILAGPHLPAPEREKLRAALFNFAASPEGKRFLETNGFGGLSPAKDADLKAMDRYAQEAKRLLDTP